MSSNEYQFSDSVTEFLDIKENSRDCIILEKLQQAPLTKIHLSCREVILYIHMRDID